MKGPDGSHYRRDTVRTRRGHTARLAAALGDRPVDTITADDIEGWLSGLGITSASRGTVRRSLSRFFGWCSEPGRRWVAVNPATILSKARREAPKSEAPAILTPAQARRLLRAARRYKRGLLVPHLTLCLFAGIRPTEVSRLSWRDVNMVDREIRLSPGITKTHRGRVVPIDDTTAAWLTAFRTMPLNPPRLRWHMRTLMQAIGFGRPTTRRPKLKPYQPDVMRHSAASYMLRRTGSFGRVAEVLGNSEAIIRQHYLGLVSSSEADEFWGLKPDNLLPSRPLRLPARKTA